MRSNSQKTGFVKWGLGCLWVVCMLSCRPYASDVESVLSLAGENRRELEAVLEHYQDSGLKRKAAEFLIGNMAGLAVPDSAALAARTDFYLMADSVRRKYKTAQRARWAILIDSLWDVCKERNRYAPVKHVPLCQVVSARQMITEIELAFAAWQANALTRDCSWDDFCEYILPFYRDAYFALDDARSYFFREHAGKYYKDARLDVRAATDSVLIRYKDIEYDTFYASDIPALSAGALMRVGGGRCTERGEFNSQLLSALGMPVAVDFVPQWGNRNEHHSWNVLVLKGRKYAFDPFWHQNNWIYDGLYDNTGRYDPYEWGEFRAPKVYRKTYATHWESSLLDKGIPLEDIPPLFRNFKMKDVTDEYAETADVEVLLTETPPEKAVYAYLCIYDYTGWKPVQFGKIKQGRALFRRMGKNMVYLPCYYKGGRLLPAALPFLLGRNGSRQQLEPLDGKPDTVAIAGADPFVYWSIRYLHCMSGTRIMGCDRPDGEEHYLGSISSHLTLEHTTLRLYGAAPCRFVRMYLPSDSLALGDLAFYASGKKIRVKGVTSSLLPLSEHEQTGHLFDAFKTTCFRGKASRNLVDIDLGQSYKLDSIEVFPYFRPNVFTGEVYELQYWNGNGWTLLERKEGNPYCLFFSPVPRNALLRLVHCARPGGQCKTNERVFIYRDGEVIWM